MQKRLPDEWIERIFMRLHGRFGNSFFDKFRIGLLNQNGEDEGVLNAKDVWAVDCGKLSVDRIKKGLDAKYDYPPSCDEFIAKCVATADMYQDHALLKLTHTHDPEIRKVGVEKVNTMIADRANTERNYKAWADKIIANPDRYSYIAVRYAKEALRV